MKIKLWAFLTIIIFLTMACSLPQVLEETSEPEKQIPYPTVTSQPSTFSPFQANTPAINHHTLEMIAKIGRGNLSQTAFSNDGKLIAGYASSKLYIINGDNLKIIREINSQGIITSLEFSANSTYIIAFCYENQSQTTNAKFRGVKVWKASDLSLVQAYDKVSKAAISPDEKLLATVSTTASDANTVNVHEFNSTDKHIWNKTLAESITAIQFVANSSLIGVSTMKSLTIFDYGSNLTKKDFSIINLGHNPLPWKISPDGQKIVLNTYIDSNLQFQIWDILTGKRLSQFSALKTDNVIFSPDSEVIILYDTNEIINLRKIPEGTDISAHYDLHNSCTYPSFQFSADRKTLKIICDSLFELVDVLSGESIGNQYIEDFQPKYLPIALSSDGSILAVASINSIDLWKISEKIIFKRLAYDKSYDQYELLFSSDGRHLYASTNEGVIDWNISTGKIERKFVDEGCGTTFLDISPDGELLVTGDASSGWCGVNIIKISDFSKVYPPKDPTNDPENLGWVTYGKFSKDNKFIFLLNSAEKVIVLNLSDYKQVRSFDFETGRMSSGFSFSPNKKYFVNGEYLEDISTWEKKKISPENVNVTASAFSLDSAYVVLGYYDFNSSQIAIWDINASKIIEEMPLSNSSQVYPLILCPSQRENIFAMKLTDGSIELWRVK